jgi:hypothetical protein
MPLPVRVPDWRHSAETQFLTCRLCPTGAIALAWFLP